MKQNHLAMLSLYLASVGLVPLAAGQDGNPPGVPARTIVTVEAKHKGIPPTLGQQDVAAYEHNDPLQVSEWTPLQGAQAGLDLLILLDDGSGMTLGGQLNDIRFFIRAQPNTTAIGVGYMQNGTVRYAAKWTRDHAEAAKSLRIPIGEPGINGSPYFSLSDAIKNWPEGAERREVLMVTDGIDRYGNGTGLDDPYVNAAIGDAQRAGVVVFSIYTHGAGHFGHSFWRNSWGQNFLSQLSDETGGESYYMGMGSPVSFKPYLDDLTMKLNHQYRITFLAKAENKAQLTPIKLHTEVPNADLAYPSRVWVAAGK
jgi:hypothetical protein